MNLMLHMYSQRSLYGNEFDTLNLIALLSALSICRYPLSAANRCHFPWILDRTGPAAVVVLVHGESYEFGTGNAYDGSVFSAYADVAVVTLNYRLGALGFLSTTDNSASGNYALFDLIAALHWIQNNIADFGGDSSRVTLLAHGYGASLASFLSLIPVTKSKLKYILLII